MHLCSHKPHPHPPNGVARTAHCARVCWLGSGAVRCGVPNAHHRHSPAPNAARAGAQMRLSPQLGECVASTGSTNALPPRVAVGTPHQPPSAAVSTTTTAAATRASTRAVPMTCGSLLPAFGCSWGRKEGDVWAGPIVVRHGTSAGCHLMLIVFYVLFNSSLLENISAPTSTALVGGCVRGFG